MNKTSWELIDPGVWVPRIISDFPITLKSTEALHSHPIRKGEMFVFLKSSETFVLKDGVRMSPEESLLFFMWKFSELSAFQIFRTNLHLWVKNYGWMCKQSCIYKVLSIFYFQIRSEGKAHLSGSRAFPAGESYFSASSFTCPTASFRAESDIERVWSEWTTGVVCRQDLDISAVCLVCVSSWKDVLNAFEFGKHCSRS